MRFECPGCDTILTRDAALKHTNHGGICNTMYPIRHETKSANDHDIRDRVRKIEEESNQHNIKKKEDGNEENDKQKRIDEIKNELRKLDDDELNSILESLRVDLEELKKNQTEDDDKQSKEASVEFIGLDNYESKNSSYHVLSLDQHSDSVSADRLLISLGSSE